MGMAKRKASVGSVRLAKYLANGTPTFRDRKVNMGKTKSSKAVKPSKDEQPKAITSVKNENVNKLSSSLEV